MSFAPGYIIALFLMCMAGLGLGGEGYLSFSIATPTGEGADRNTRGRVCSPK